jgi:hypothetical protein
MSKLKFLACIALSLVSQSLVAQSISMYKTFGGVHYTMADSVLSENQVKMILLESSPKGYQEFKSAKKFSTLSAISGFTGGALVLVPLVTAVLGGEPEWILAGAGAVLVATSFQMSRIYKARALNALDIYNEKFTSRIETHVYFTGMQIGLAVKF